METRPAVSVFCPGGAARASITHDNFSIGSSADSDRLDRALGLYRDLSVALSGRIAAPESGNRRKQTARSRRSSVRTAAPCSRFSKPRQVLSNEAEPAAGGRRRSTSTPHAPRSLRDLLSGLPEGELTAFLDALTPNALMSLPWLFEHWALERHQLPPEGDWTTWVILGGRGAGKTRAGAEWIRAQVEGGKPGDPGTRSRVALVGETLDQAREVMVFGDVGHPRLLAARPAARVAGDAQAAGLAERGGGAGLLGERSRVPARAAVRLRLVRRARQVEEGRGGLGHAAVRAAPRDAAAGGGDDDAAGERRCCARSSTTPGTVVTRAPTSANRMHLARELPRGGDREVRRHAARAAGARRRAHRRRRGRALDLGDARGGAGAARARARPGRGGGRPAGDRRRRAGRLRHHRRRRGAAPGRRRTGGRGDRGRQPAGRLAADAGPSGRSSSTTRTAPTGWSPRSTRAASWSRR